MARKKKTHPAQMALLELALKTAPCVPAIRQEVRDWVADGYRGATLTGTEWVYRKVLQKEFEKLQPADFEDLIALDPIKVL